jgi:5-methylcytosine-specific restriction endonuclease McrA
MRYKTLDGFTHQDDPNDSRYTACGLYKVSHPGSPVANIVNCPNCRVDVLQHQLEQKENQDQLQRLTALEQERAQARAAELRKQYDLEQVKVATIAAESRTWWKKYDDYLNSESWLLKRAKVLERAGRRCEACGEAWATQVHHVTYEHVFDEPLFDLRAVCVPCHERLTAADRSRRKGVFGREED